MRRTVTPNRWRIPIGAVAVHVCIGSVYAWSTFNRPIQALFPDQPWWFSPPYTTFTTALVLLGLSAAFGGPWVERRGPRVAATAAALFFGTGLIIGGLGLSMRQPVIVFLGMGVIGGIGCGLGYISPGQHAREVVSRSPRHGDRHGDHGLWRRRVPRRLPERVPDGSHRRGQHGHRARRRVSRDHADRLAAPRAAAGRMEAGRLDARRSIEAQR